MKLLFMFIACSLLRADDSPVRIRVELDTIELSKSTAAQQPSYAEVLQLLKKNQATRKDYQIITAPPGERARSWSIKEFVYPADYELSSFHSGKPVSSLSLVKIPQLRPEWFPMWECRQVGTILEIEPSRSGPDLISLLWASSKTTHPRDITYVTHRDQWGIADLKRPVIHVQKIGTYIQLRDSQMTLLQTYSPLLEDGTPSPDKSILVFVRATLIQ